MRLLLYNIRYGAGIGRRFHLPVPYSGYLKPTNGNFKKIVNFIKAKEPDIVGLVEVDFGSFRAEKSNQAELVAQALNLEAVYRPKYGVSSLIGKVPLLSKQGNALLTGQELLDRRFHYFQNGVKRLVIEVELPDVKIFLVHLSLKYRHRQHQLNDLHALLSGCDKPVIVAGDFNVLRGDHELQYFMSASGLVSANTEKFFSWPSRLPLVELDFIFHSPRIRTLNFDVPRICLSDHAPLVWDFTIDPKRRAAINGKKVKRVGNILAKTGSPLAVPT